MYILFKLPVRHQVVANTLPWLSSVTAPCTCVTAVTIKSYGKTCKKDFALRKNKAQPQSILNYFLKVKKKIKRLSASSYPFPYPSLGSVSDELLRSVPY